MRGPLGGRGPGPVKVRVHAEDAIGGQPRHQLADQARYLVQLLRRARDQLHLLWRRLSFFKLLFGNA